jgi:hypothetical protein
MSKLSLMTSHMSIMTNNNMCHIILPHHVLNDYCLQWLVKFDLKFSIIFVLYDWNSNHELSHIFEDFFKWNLNVMQTTRNDFLWFKRYYSLVTI